MNRGRRLLLLLAVMLVAAASVRGQDIDDFVKSWIEKQHVPGAAIAVVKDGAVIKAEGYGLADVEHRIPARPDTVFKIGSLSKQFIATGIMPKVPTGVPMVRHGASMNGFRAGHARWPRQRLAVIVLTNLTNAPYEGLAANIAITYAPQLRTAPRLPAAAKR
jgi:Beta-lactamase